MENKLPTRGGGSDTISVCEILTSGLSTYGQPLVCLSDGPGAVLGALLILFIWSSLQHREVGAGHVPIAQMVKLRHRDSEQCPH